MTLAGVKQAVGRSGLAWRGALHPDPADFPLDSPAGTLVLVGFVGREQWPNFANSPEAGDGESDPLDRWSVRIIGALAESLGAKAVFPFGGPPWAPFLRWAQQAEPVHPSPTGMLIHPDWGLWHAWRGALAFRERFVLPEPDGRVSPCETCPDKPCLSACPVSAFTARGYDISACVAHLETQDGADCMGEGCRARRACPVGAANRYGPDQARFHLTAFRAAQRPDRPTPR